MHNTAGLRAPAGAPVWMQFFSREVERYIDVRMGLPVRLPEYTAANLPDAGDYIRCWIYVSDESGGAVPAFSDGVSWRRGTDRAVVT